MVSHGKFVVSYPLLYNNVMLYNHELSNIKRYTLIISHSFLNQESVYSLEGSLASRVFHKAAIMMSARIEVSLDRSTGEECVSKSTWFWVRFNSLWAIGPMASLAYWLSTLSCLLWELQHRAIHNVAACIIKTSKREHLLPRWKSEFHVIYLQLTSYHFDHILLKHVPGPAHTSRAGKLHKNVNTRR